MNTDVEDLLREGMVRFTSDLRAPAGMTRRAVQRRRRRLALRSAAGAAAVLTAGAVAVVAAGVPSARHNGTGGPAVPAAYVVKRVDSALSAAEPGAIAQMTVTTSGAVIPGGKTTTAEEWSYGDRWRSVTNSLAGHPLYDEGSSNSSVFTLVSYLTQTWARQRGLGGPAAPVFRTHGCAPLVAAGPFLFWAGLPGTGFPASSLSGNVARDLRTAVACGTLAVAHWRVRVDGIEAIELTSRRHSPIAETIWVNPSTHLPVRVVVRSDPGAPFLPRGKPVPARGKKALRETADITWLPPTAQNLAKLTVPVPAGFRRVPLAKAVRPILQQTLGGPLAGPRVPCPSPAGPACLYGPGTFGPGPLVSRPVPAPRRRTVRASS